MLKHETLKTGQNEREILQISPGLFCTDRLLAVHFSKKNIQELSFFIRATKLNKAKERNVLSSLICSYKTFHCRCACCVLGKTCKGEIHNHQNTSLMALICFPPAGYSEMCFYCE